MPVNPAEAAKSRESLRKSMRQPVDADAVQQLLFSVRLEAYCQYLAELPSPDGISYRAVYELLQEFAGIEPDNPKGEGCISDKPLTVGSLLLKASDFIYHEDEYRSYYDPVTSHIIPIKVIGEYITDMLLIRPFVMLCAGRRM